MNDFIYLQQGLTQRIMCISKLAIVLILLSVGIVKSYAKQTAAEVDTSFTAIQKEVINVVSAISTAEKRRHGHTNHVHFSIEIPAENVATLGLILDTSISDKLRHKGFLVTAVDDNSLAAIIGINVGETITRVNSERVTELTAEDRLTTLSSLQEGDILNLTIYNDEAPSASRRRTVALLIEGVQTPRMQIVVGNP
ncbi:MAG: S1-C subfamily serine protease [Glaciecola sp.]|jgi:S1-C subfamily serine protease